MLQVLPRLHPEEFAAKPGFHLMWTQGFRGTPFEWANPGWALLTEVEQLGILAAYWGMIAQLDHNIGRVLRALEQRGLGHDTLVIFTSDHGDFMGDHQMMLKGPIHYEALIRVPLIVRGPGFEAGAVSDDPVGTIDLFPTATESCGVAAPAHLEGRPLQGEARESVLTEDDILRGAMAFRTLTTKRYRITRNAHDPAGGELYDLQEDPGELVNLWGEASRGRLRDELLALLDEVMRHDIARELPVVCQAG
jgi:arylsulfatase A-like enzyme